MGVTRPAAHAAHNAPSRPCRGHWRLLASFGVAKAQALAVVCGLIGRGNSIVLRDQPELQRDLLLAGRILAHLLVTTEVNREPIELP